MNFPEEVDITIKLKAKRTAIDYDEEAKQEVGVYELDLFPDNHFEEPCETKLTSEFRVDAADTGDQRDNVEDGLRRDVLFFALDGLLASTIEAKPDGSLVRKPESEVPDTIPAEPPSSDLPEDTIAPVTKYATIQAKIDALLGPYENPVGLENALAEIARLRKDFAGTLSYLREDDAELAQDRR